MSRAFTTRSRVLLLIIIIIKQNESALLKCRKTMFFSCCVNSQSVFFPFFSPRRDPSSLLRERGPRKTTPRTKISRNRMEIHGFRWVVWAPKKKKEKKFLSLSLSLSPFSFPRVEVLRESFGASRTGSLDFFLLSSSL